MARKFDRKLVLEDGSQYLGYGFGSDCDKVCELVFNTSMVGYQEILSDPTCTYQMVVMTYPVIGNYGITDDDFETRVPTIGGLVVRSYTDTPSNFRYTKTLSEELEENHIPGISGVDTRKITRLIRDNGTLKALITDVDTPLEKALQTISNRPVLTDAVSVVSCKKKWYSRTTNPKFNVVAIDCGIKLSFVKALNNLGCNVTVVPYNFTAEEILALKPDGVFVSNGPGAPEDAKCVLDTVKALIGKVPMFGVGLGHLMICRAYGADTYKLKFGHMGSNHPVRNLANGTVEVVGQNHSHAVCEKSLENTKLSVTYTNILDNTVEGVECKEDKTFSVQFYPDDSSKPQGSTSLFEKFIKMIEDGENNA